MSRFPVVVRFSSTNCSIMVWLLLLPSPSLRSPNIIVSITVILCILLHIIPFISSQSVIFFHIFLVSTGALFGKLLSWWTLNFQLFHYPLLFNVLIISFDFSLDLCVVRVRKYISRLLCISCYVFNPFIFLKLPINLSEMNKFAVKWVLRLCIFLSRVF